MTSTITSLPLTLQSPPTPRLYYITLPPHHSSPLASLCPTPTSKILTMQRALPYKDWLPAAASTSTSTTNDGATTTAANSSITKLVAENPVVVFARSGCCMCHVVKLLLHGHGVNPTIFDINEQNEAATIEEFFKIIDNPEERADRPPPPFPTVFVGGNLFGGLDEVMAAHISGELVPLLRKAGALWL